jgi:hypothetical protein
MGDAFAMGRIESIENQSCVGHGLVQRQRTLQGRAVDQFHHDVVRTDILDPADIGVIEGRVGAASRSKRAANESLENLSATSRSSWASRAFQTSPMPPAPMASGVSASYLLSRSEPQNAQWTSGMARSCTSNLLFPTESPCSGAERIVSFTR